MFIAVRKGQLLAASRTCLVRGSCHAIQTVVTVAATTHHGHVTVLHSIILLIVRTAVWQERHLSLITNGQTFLIFGRWEKCEI